MAFENVTEDGSCPTPAERMALEDFNKYSVILDIDGRAWSSRIAFLLLQGTPILKQVGV